MKRLLFLLGFALAAALLSPTVATAAPITFTLYCTGGNTCSTSNAGLTSYWTLSGGVTETSATTFDMTMSAAATGEASANLLSWSITGFFGSGASVNILNWTGPGTADAGKSNNGNDQCNDHVGGAVCFDLTGLTNNGYAGTGIPASWDVTGTFTGTLGTSCNTGDGTCLVFLADSEFTSGPNAGKTAFAISQDVNAGGNQVPEPSSVALLAGGLAMFGSRRLRSLFAKKLRQ